jgi:hypothetical protein
MNLRRLRAMPPEEVLWRAGTLARTCADRVVDRVRPPRWRRRSLERALSPAASSPDIRRAIRAEDWRSVNVLLVRSLRSRPCRFVLDPGIASQLCAVIRSRWPDAVDDAARRADRILAGHYDLLGYTALRFDAEDGSLGWHRDPVHGRRSPKVFWTDVPYLDPRIGDHKIIWELNRHQHFLQFGRALWLTGDRRYARAIMDHVESWLEGNPPRLGINWASMLEVALRSLSWLWALQFLLATPDSSDSADHDQPWLVDLLVALDAHMRHVELNLSYYFSPNTHLIGEGLGLYVVGAALPELAGSRRWAARGRAILLREADRQIRGDGGHVEGSTHYHRYTLDMYLHALLAARCICDEAAASSFAGAVARLADFARAMANDRGRMPLIGDDDGGLLWPLKRRTCSDIRDSLALAAVALNRHDLAPWDIPEEAFWIGGRAVIDAAADAPRAQRHSPREPSRTLRQSGYVVARATDGSHAVFDAGSHGFMNGGHAHADALAITLQIAGRPLLVDAGTSTYTMDPEVRDRLRSTASHNTIELDGRGQSQPDGPFHWRTRTDALLHGSRHNPAFDWAEASHDGYAPVRVRRTLFRSARSGWFIADEILGDGRHCARAHWHFDPDCALSCDGAQVSAWCDDVARGLLLVSDGSVEIAYGDGLGWHAPVYGQLVPAWMAVVTREAVAPFSLVTWVGERVRGPISLDRVAAACEPGGDVVAAQLTSGERTSLLLLRPGEPLTSRVRSADTLDYHTDARVLYHACQPGHGIEVSVIDATRVLSLRDERLSIVGETLIPDLHLAIEDDTMDLQALEPPSRLQLFGTAVAHVRRIRLNGRLHAVSGSRFETLEIDGADWRQSRVELALSAR